MYVMLYAGCIYMIVIVELNRMELYTESIVENLKIIIFCLWKYLRCTLQIYC